jgi:hypothetical protein
MSIELRMYATTIKARRRIDWTRHEAKYRGQRCSHRTKYHKELMLSRKVPQGTILYGAHFSTKIHWGGAAQNKTN